MPTSITMNPLSPVGTDAEIGDANATRPGGLSLFSGRFLIFTLMSIAAFLSLNEAQAGTISYSGSAESSVSYQLTTDAATLIPGTGLQGEAVDREVAYETISLQQFDPTLGTLTNVDILLQGFGTTQHNYIGACESITTALCGFRVEGASEATFGWNVPVLGSSSPAPPIVDGVPSAPTADVFETQELNSSRFSVFPIIGQASGPKIGRGFGEVVQFGYEDAFVGTGTFDIITEALSQTILTLNCNVAVLAICQGGVLTSHDFNAMARVVHRYIPIVDTGPGGPVAQVPEPSVLTLFFGGLGLLAFAARRKRNIADTNLQAG